MTKSIQKIGSPKKGHIGSHKNTRKIQKGIIHVQASFNNMIVTVSIINSIPRLNRGQLPTKSSLGLNKKSLGFIHDLFIRYLKNPISFAWNLISEISSKCFHIKLACPVTYVWYLKRLPSYIANLLDKSLKELTPNLEFRGSI